MTFLALSSKFEILYASILPFFFDNDFSGSSNSIEPSISSTSECSGHESPISSSYVGRGGKTDDKGNVVDPLRFKVDAKVSFLELFPFERLFTLQSSVGEI